MEAIPMSDDLLSTLDDYLVWAEDDILTLLPGAPNICENV